MTGVRSRTSLPSVALALALAPPLPANAVGSGPPQPPRIMPLGDSITEGRSGDATWRYWLQKSLEANGCAVDFVGSRSGVLDGKPRFSDFDPDHEGHWGWTTAQVKAQIDRWARDARPGIVLLHLGTNDLGSDPERIAANLGAIVDSLRRANSTVEIYLARLIPAAGVPDGTMKRTNDAIARLAVDRDRPESRLIVVDQYTGFDPRVDTYDGVHPNESGEKKMARRWFEALRARLDCLRPAGGREGAAPLRHDRDGPSSGSSASSNQRIAREPCSSIEYDEDEMKSGRSECSRPSITS